MIWLHVSDRSLNVSHPAGKCEDRFAEDFFSFSCWHMPCPWVSLQCIILICLAYSTTTLDNRKLWDKPVTTQSRRKGAIAETFFAQRCFLWNMELCVAGPLLPHSIKYSFCVCILIVIVWYKKTWCCFKAAKPQSCQKGDHSFVGLSLQKQRLTGKSGGKNGRAGKTRGSPRGEEVFLNDVVFGLKM